MVTKLQKCELLRNLCLHFARQDRQDEKKRKENHSTKVTKIPKTKRQKSGMTETQIYWPNFTGNLEFTIQIYQYVITNSDMKKLCMIKYLPMKSTDKFDW